MTETATLRVRRAAGGYRDRARAYRIEVDGVSVGELKSGDALEESIPVGAHVLQAKIDWAGSEELSIHAESGETINVSVESTGASGLGALFKKRAYLKLTVI